MSTEEVDLYVIGKNDNNELGLDFINVNELTKFNHSLCVKQVNCTLNSTFFTDNNNRYFVSGCNEQGQCGIDSTKQYVKQPYEIKFFQQNNIKMNKICSSVCGKSVFWIGNNNKLYGSGNNTSCQLGLGSWDTTNRHKPELMTLNNVIDVKYGADFTTALCSPAINVADIINNWSRLAQISIPYDIIKLTENIFSNNQIYSTNKHGSPVWKRIDIFDDKQIIKIECGRYHCLYLESNGDV